MVKGLALVLGRAVEDPAGVSADVCTSEVSVFCRGIVWRFLPGRAAIGADLEWEKVDVSRLDASPRLPVGFAGVVT